MDFLANENVIMRNSIYWCYMEEHGFPNEKIQGLVQRKKCCLVRTAGFDAIMLAIGNALFSDKIGVHETEKYLNNRTSIQIESYEKEYKKLIEHEKNSNTMGASGESNQSDDELKKEIEKITERSDKSENERKQSNQMTAWDYWRQGNRYFNSGDYESAVESYSNAIARQSDIVIFYNDRGCAYAEMGENEKALSDYTKAIELKPDYANPYRHSGTIWKKRKNLEKAFSFYTKAIELDPKYKEAYLDRAEVYRLMREIEKAEADEEIAANL